MNVDILLHPGGCMLGCKVNLQRIKNTLLRARSSQTLSKISAFLTFAPIFQIFDYAQYYLNLHSTNRRDKTKSAADFDFASEVKEAPVEAQWRLEYNFTAHYRFRRRRMPEHLGRGIITSSVLESLERKLANNRCVTVC